jgi:hypothetical protein
MRPLVLQSKTAKGAPVTLYGEDHAHINNHFYQALNLSGQIVLVEHSTLFPTCKPHERKLFAKAKGSEWVWFTRISNGLPVICMDNRLENGFLSAYEETALETLPLPVLLEIAVAIMRILLRIKHQFLPVKDPFHRLTKTITEQVQALVLRPDPIVQENLINNLLKISSMSVDMNILAILNGLDSGGPISIFAGLNHVLRVHAILQGDDLGSDLFQPFGSG